MLLRLQAAKQFQFCQLLGATERSCVVWDDFNQKKGSPPQPYSLLSMRVLLKACFLACNTHTSLCLINVNNILPLMLCFSLQGTIIQLYSRSRKRSIEHSLWSCLWPTRHNTPVLIIQLAMSSQLKSWLVKCHIRRARAFVAWVDMWNVLRRNCRWLSLNR